MANNSKRARDLSRILRRRYKAEHDDWFPPSPPPPFFPESKVETAENAICYLMREDERYFPKPAEFIPERWTTETHLVIDKRAFIPFS